MRAPLHGYTLSSIAHTRDLKGRGRADGKRVSSIQASNGAGSSVQDHDGCTADGLSTLISDRAADGNVLGLRAERDQQGCHYRQKHSFRLQLHNMNGCFNELNVVDHLNRYKIIEHG